jgi:hypothetical protein
MVPPNESPNQSHQRLLKATAASRFLELPHDYGWVPLTPGQAPDATAIACVRDDDVWHQLSPVAELHQGPRMCVVSFHFPDHISSAGFIAWMAAWLRQEADTGVVVIGGRDKSASVGLDQGSFGVFDYWCCGADNRRRFVDAIERRIVQGRDI